MKPQLRHWSRREFLASGVTAGLAVSASAVWLSGTGRRTAPVPARIRGASSKIGHRLLDEKFQIPTEHRTTGVVIVGGGMAGLSAAWELGRKGFDDYLLLELEDETGGNSRSGENAISAYPWGAHYVPFPGRDANFVRELFEELGVIRGYDAQLLPIYNEDYVCFAPQERLWIHGEWQEGLLPQLGATSTDHAQYDAFFARMDKFKQARGRDGRRAFTIPLDLSSRDPELLALDRISMAEYLVSKGWNSRPLHWYVNYCCRDDYGTRYDELSAWAGIHYFASRAGEGSGIAGHPVLTWPEGNGWIAKRLREKAHGRIETGALTFNVGQEGNRAYVDSLDARSGRSIRTYCRAVIMATPRFIAHHLVESSKSERPKWAPEFTYAPWMVANVSLGAMPSKGTGASLSWDNVLFDSPSLGYVVATHQRQAIDQRKTVLSYYLPLSDEKPEVARKRALETSPEAWRDLIFSDLRKAHPEIESQAEAVDIWLWGHAMIRAQPGFIWGKARASALIATGKIHYAHSDMSGISLFEEAQYRGVLAAQAALRDCGGIT